MIRIRSLEVKVTSLVSRDDRQRAVFTCETSCAGHLYVSVYRGQERIVDRLPFAVNGGRDSVDVMLPVQKESFDAVWEISDGQGNILLTTHAPWKAPREWTIYVMISSHTDIGLHNSQYVQRYNASRFIDEAAALCDASDDREKNDRYRYVMEGTWFWNNYGMDRGREAAERIVEDYIRPGRMGVCCGVAGNHIQTYGLEELCRSAYERRRLREQWGLDCSTMTMIDNNGLPWSMIQAYADAGYRNLIFAPNQWNPLPSTIWKKDVTQAGSDHNPSAGGGGSRIDVRYDSQLPMVFEWESAQGSRILIWASAMYHYGGSTFGFLPDSKQESEPARIKRQAAAEMAMCRQLEQLEERYPYDVWMFACYYDDQEPDMALTDRIRDWNAKWKYPALRTLGDPDEPFALLRERFPDQIPVLRGDITGGWYQHPLTVPELMSRKFEADRTLPTAEKWATAAALTDSGYTYPAVDFRRAWEMLVYNDEHSYGTSGYQGRRVYETWIQHRDWIDKASALAQSEKALALQTLAAHIPADGPSAIVFNPTSRRTDTLVRSRDGDACALVQVPPFGYRVVGESSFLPAGRSSLKCDGAVRAENDFYAVEFAENGTISSIYDKELGRELLDRSCGYGANTLFYTRDNHRSFSSPGKAEFELTRSREGVCVTIRTKEDNCGAQLVQTVTLPAHIKRIDIDNRLFHVRDMINKNRYYRFMYFAFPFAVENSRRLCHLNGTVAEYAKDVTGHGTDVYMAVNEWCCAENDEFGAALFMMDSQVTEFDHIHPEKTDFGDVGEGSKIFSYVANDWLQMHTPGGSHLDYRFRYAITSYTGGYRAAGIPEMAELYVNPADTVWVDAQQGDLPVGEHSFLEMQTGLRLLCLKRADDAQGMIARFYGEGEVRFAPSLCPEPSTVDERPAQCPAASGFITYRLGRDTIRIPERKPEEPQQSEGTPLPIGSVYTGLVTKPRAAAGENRGHLYLLWGASMEPDFSHYKLYRSKEPGFCADESSFLADVAPEQYRVGRYEDTGLADHTCYYYRVCAVNRAGVCGPMSEEFSAWTREPLAD